MFSLNGVQKIYVKSGFVTEELFRLPPKILWLAYGLLQFERISALAMIFFFINECFLFVSI